MAGVKDDPIDLDYMPEIVFLEKCGIPCFKGSIFEKIRDEYSKLLRELSRNAKTDSQLRRDLEDAAEVAEKANKVKLLARHQEMWKKILTKAVNHAKTDLEKYESMADQIDEPRWSNWFAPILRDVKHRYEIATEKRDLAKKLIADLRCHSGDG